ncbi:pseudouridine synthase [Butyrivibrio sp. AE2032]|uniref:pseudouridine synthase n=1 Tax=Butyrivibrio sp. AE2032 TaxID=1458463 RepID=UPI000AFD03B0|nr:pseudouridine synthase [Butyrivibrio sp. AE2032]
MSADMTRILAKGKGYQILYKERGEDSEKIAPAGLSVLSRLDVPVPGIIAAADSGKRIRILNKRYYLVCQGRFEEEEGVMEDLLFHDSRSNRTFPVKRMRKGVKEARLTYRILAYNEEKDLSYASVVLDTGRTHQIRTQFASRKHPLAGDGKYGSRIKCPVALVMAELTYDEGEGTEPVTVTADPLEELPEV